MLKNLLLYLKYTYCMQISIASCRGVNFTGKRKPFSVKAPIALWIKVVLNHCVSCISQKFARLFNNTLKQFIQTDLWCYKSESYWLQEDQNQISWINGPQKMYKIDI